MMTKSDAIQMDFDDAQHFIDFVTQGKGRVTFQTFDDDKNQSRDYLARVYHGILAEHRGALQTLNDQGAAICVMINVGDESGRRDENVLQVRAIFLDLDGTPLEVIEDCPFKPHMVIQSSPGRWHVYWRVKGCPVEDFKSIQQALANRFGGDEAVCNPSRVMRLPGSFHRKEATPYRTRIVDWEDDPEPIDVTELASWLAVTLGQKGPEGYGRHLQCSSVASVSSVQATLPQHFGERHQRLFDYARRMKSHYPDATPRERRQFSDDWYAHAEPNIRTKDRDICYADFEEGWHAVKIPYGSELDEVLNNLLTAPEMTELGYGPMALKLADVMYSLHVHQVTRHNGDPIIMAARMAGGILGIDHREANKLLHVLERDGVIKLIEKGGAPKRASRWAWTWKVGSDAEEMAQEFARVGNESRVQ